MIQTISIEENTFKLYERKFKALADEKRLQLLHLLANSKEAICVCDLVDHMEMAQSKLSYHLKILLNAELITKETRGTWSYYSLNHSEMNALLSENLCCLFRGSEACCEGRANNE